MDNKISYRKQVEIDIICKSLIGKEMEIVNSSNPNQIGIKGVLVYESANLLFLNDGLKIKKILKSSVTVRFLFLQDKIVELDCRLLMGTLVSRIKKLK